MSYKTSRHVEYFKSECYEVLHLAYCVLVVEERGSEVMRRANED